ncbi:hypothetical protein BGX28_000513 [Mortierella sp. GBA30]|nr:hypothetical protein BGX28_000513 [Mortierella sp. GBA30]
MAALYAQSTIASSQESTSSQTRQPQGRSFEAEFVSITGKPFAETSFPSYLRPYLSKSRLCPAFDPGDSNCPTPNSTGERPTSYKPERQGCGSSPKQRPGYLRQDGDHSSTLTSPLLAQPQDIRPLLDQLSSLKSLIQTFQRYVDEYKEKTQAVESKAKEQITAMLRKHEKELLSALDGQLRALVDVALHREVGGISEAILQQIAQHSREAQRELAKELNGWKRGFETAYLSKTMELKSEIKSLTEEIKELKSTNSMMLHVVAEETLIQSEREESNTTRMLSSSSVVGDKARRSCSFGQDIESDRHTSTPSDMLVASEYQEPLVRREPARANDVCAPNNYGIKTVLVTYDTPEKSGTTDIIDLSTRTQSLPKVTKRNTSRRLSSPSTGMKPSGLKSWGYLRRGTRGPGVRAKTQCPNIRNLLDSALVSPTPLTRAKRVRI